MCSSYLIFSGPFGDTSLLLHLSIARIITFIFNYPFLLLHFCVAWQCLCRLQYLASSLFQILPNFLWGNEYFFPLCLTFVELLQMSTSTHGLWGDQNLVPPGQVCDWTSDSAGALSGSHLHYWKRLCSNSGDVTSVQSCVFLLEIFVEFLHFKPLDWHVYMCVCACTQHR